MYNAYQSKSKMEIGRMFQHQQQVLNRYIERLIDKGKLPSKRKLFDVLNYSENQGYKELSDNPVQPMEDWRRVVFEKAILKEDPDEYVNYLRDLHMNDFIDLMELPR